MVFSGKRILVHLVLVTSTLLFAGCTSVEKSERPAMQTTKEVRHSNGLLIGVPEGFAAKQTETGFIVEPEGNKNLQLRRPVIIYVSLVKDQNIPRDSLLRTKSLTGKKVRYHVDKSEGGSGGETYSLEAYESLPAGHIEYSQAIQSEDGEPDFATCWSVVETTKYEEINMR